MPRVRVLGPPRSPPPVGAAPRITRSSSAHESPFQLDDPGDHAFCPSVWSALWHLSHLLAYHVGNISFSFASFVIVAGGLALALLLLPFCGFGVVVIHALLQMAYHLADVDARFHNTMVTKDGERIEFPEDAERAPLLPLYDLQHTYMYRYRRGPCFDEASLSRPSPRSVLLLVYFGSIKLALGILSGFIFGCLVVSTAGFFTDKSHIDLTIDKPSVEKVDGAPWSYRACLFGMVLSCIGLHVIGRIMQATTRFFCCEHRV